MDIVPLLAILTHIYVVLLGILFHKMIPQSPRVVEVMYSTTFVISLDRNISNQWTLETNSEFRLQRKYFEITWHELF